MTSISILARFAHFRQVRQALWPWFAPSKPDLRRPTLQEWYRHRSALPAFVQQSAIAMRYLDLLGPLAWDAFPERDLHRHSRNAPTPHTVSSFSEVNNTGAA